MKHVPPNVMNVQEPTFIVPNVTLQEFKEMNPIVDAQMDNGITTEFVKLVTTLVKLVEHPPPIVSLVHQKVKEN